MVKGSPGFNCDECPIRHHAVCAMCDSSDLAVLEKAKRYRTLAAGQSLAVAGEPLETVASLLSGCAIVSKTLEDGRRQNVGLLFPSDFIGRPWRAHAAYDVEALSEVSLCCFDRVTFERIVRNRSHIATRLLAMTLDELDAAREWSVVLGRLNARERVAAFLLMLGRRSAWPNRSDAGPTTLSLPLTREVMADFLGLTLETTSRQIAALRRDGLIEGTSSREVHIPSFQRLATESGFGETLQSA